MTRSCGTCRWFERPYDPEDPLGLCNWPKERLPWSLRYGNRERLSVYDHEGTECSCYEEKKDEHLQV